MTPMARKLFVGISLCTALAIYVVTRSPPPPRPAAQLTPEQRADLMPAPHADSKPQPVAQPPPPPEEDPADSAPEIVAEDGEGS